MCVQCARLGKVSPVPRLERVLPERDQTAAFLLITHATAAALESVAAQDEKQLSQLPPHKTSWLFVYNFKKWFDTKTKLASNLPRKDKDHLRQGYA